MILIHGTSLRTVLGCMHFAESICSVITPNRTTQSSSSGDQSAFLMRRHKGDDSESSFVKSLAGVTE